MEFQKKMPKGLNLFNGLYRLNILNYFKSTHHIFPVYDYENKKDIIFKSRDKKDRVWKYCKYGDYKFKYTTVDNGNSVVLELIYDSSKVEIVKTDKLISNRYMITDKSTVISRYSQRVMKQQTTKAGYKRIAFNGCKMIGVHRLVARAFCPKPQHLQDKPYEQLHVNHLDSNRSNNHYTNLEWCTAAENIQHAYYSGNAKGKKGQENNMSKFTNDEVKEIRLSWAKESQDYLYTIADHATKYDITMSNMRCILLNISYVDNEYIPDLKRLSKRKGEMVVNASFKQSYVDLIRKDFGIQIQLNQKYTFLKHAEKYQCPLTVMRNILLNLSYVDKDFIPYTFKLNNKSGIFNPRSKLTQSDVKWIRDDYALHKKPIFFYASKYNIGVETARRIIKNEAYEDPQYENPIK